ncbi:MAG: YggS family pyridoxal phosphate-dependent enzyme [Clostridia bacterium]|nr:YggS family pyridoxal phosphate-dependent enzyme [Clostridia bacterium]MBQ8268596.1 YggS family pyridoxal phosphate-dependent enzyme [Clostridia bacterium]
MQSFENFSYIKKNYEELKGEIDALAKNLGRPPVTLVCVTKSGTDEELLALAHFGATDMGENRPQEASRRKELLSENGFSAVMHEIGNLQTNKVRLIADKCALIHSLDSLSLAKEIDKQAKKLGRKIPVLIEINSGREENKGGILPEDALAFCESIREFEGLALYGVMTMGPNLEASEEYRPYFKETKKIFDTIGTRYGYATESPVLSMGMSDSYVTAIEEGATLVRVGRRLFKK